MAAATSRAARYLDSPAALPDDAHREVAELVQHREQLVARYRGLTRGFAADPDLNRARNQDRGHGIEL
jgi:hypothetical protein